MVHTNYASDYKIRLNDDTDIDIPQVRVFSPAFFGCFCMGVGGLLRNKGYNSLLTSISLFSFQYVMGDVVQCGAVRKKERMTRPNRLVKAKSSNRFPDSQVRCHSQICRSQSAEHM